MIFDPDGTLREVGHPARPSLRYLTMPALPPPTLDGQVLGWEPAAVHADADELEVMSTAGPVSAVLRHTFVGGWGCRLILSAAEPVRLDSFLLPMQAGPGCVAWGLAAGAEADFTVHPSDGQGPLLGGVLRLGSVAQITASGSTLGMVELSPGARYVLHWQWDWYATPRSFGKGRHPDLPPASAFFVGEPADFVCGEDVAVLPDEDLELLQTGHRYSLVADRSRTGALELRSARGRTALELAWVPSVAEVLVAQAEAALDRPRTRAGIVRLDAIAEGLLVQHTVSAGLLEDPDLASEALDLYTARLLDGGPLAALHATYLSGEYDRTGDPDVLHAARRAVLAEHHPTRGLGFAAMRLCVALTAANQDLAPLLQHLHRTATDLPPWQASSLATTAAAVELLAVTDAGPGASGAAGRRADIVQGAAALGLRLGAGLPGEPVAPLPAPELAYLIAVLSLLPDQLSGPLQELWGCSAPALARRATPGLITRLAASPPGEAHAWLSLALQTW